MSRKEFVERVFYPHVYQARAKCIGFNLPFDLSRLAISYGKARKFAGGFSLKLSANPAQPNIRIKSINSKAAFIEFTKPVRKNSQKKKQRYKGFFLDLKTFSFALTNKSYNLVGALKYCSIEINDSRTASLIGRYHNAVKQFLNTGNKKALKKFRKKKIKDINGNLHSLETNPDFLIDINERIEEPEFYELYAV